MRPLFVLALILQHFLTHASIISGSVIDGKTKEPLVGASVTIKELGIGTTVNLAGNFSLKVDKAGTYTIVCSFVGYKSIEQTLNVSSGVEKIKTSFNLQEDAGELSEIVVQGVLDKSDDSFAFRSEKNADQVTNVMSAKTIQLLPDITVGNILQRVSGVSIVRNSSGDGQYAIIRGMDKRYNYTLVNGIKIPSPDNKNRYVPLDIFPADLLERLEVVKSLTPNMEGDAIGGAMNMIMKSAPPSLSISATVAGGVSNVFSASRPFSGFSTDVPSKSPETLYGPNYPAKPTDFGVKQLQYYNKNMPVNYVMNFSIGNRVLNNKLGFIVALSYQNIYRGTNSIFYSPSEPTPLPNPNTYQFYEIQLREFSNLQKRLGAHAKLDYSINSKNKLSLYNLFSQLSEEQHRSYHNPEGHGKVTADFHDRSKYTVQNVFNSSLRGDHSLLPKLKLDWTASYSIATSNTPAWSDMTVRYRYDDSGTLVSTALLPVDQQWTNNTDKDYTGYVNLNYSLKPNLDISTGGMARFKNRDNLRTAYELNTIIPGSNTSDYQAYTSIDQATFNFLPQQYGYASSTDPNNYTAKENITAGYVQGKYTVARFNIVGGARFENTLQEYHSQLSPLLPGRDGSIAYSDLLPSLNVKYALTEKQNLRLSYYKAISRPNYFEFVPVTLPGDNWDEEGNYDIKHVSADNYDFRYELFDKGRDQLLAGIFYKQINNPIEFGLDPKGVSSYAVKPYNYGTAINYGFELVVAKYIGNFGLSANYTYTNSSITTNKLLIHQISSTESSKDIVPQTRPLQGQSNHIANASFIYKNAKLGLDAQLAWVFTGRRINFVSPFKDLDYWQRDFSQLDLSAEKRIFKKFNLFVKITNLTDAPLIVEVINPNNLGDVPGQDRSDRIVVQKDVFHQTFLAGVRYKL